MVLVIEQKRNDVIPHLNKVHSKRKDFDTLFTWHLQACVKVGVIDEQ